MWHVESGEAGAAADPQVPAPPGLTVCVASDLTEEGHSGRRYLTVRDGELRVLAAPGAWPPRARPGRRMRPGPWASGGCCWRPSRRGARRSRCAGSR